MLIIDAHAHIYSDDEKRYPPIAEPIRPPRKSGSLSALERVTRENKVTGACIVQPGTFYRWDNRYILDSAKSTAEWTAGICSLDPDDAGSYMLLKQYASEDGIRGLRSYAAADGRVDHPGVRELWRACQETNIVVSVMIQSDKADELGRMLEKFDQLPVVIDHCLNLKAGPQKDKILAQMLRLAKFPNAYAKLSFLPTGSLEEYPFRDLHGACHKIIEAYGPGRCVWGSNFPCELWTPKATYAQHLSLFTNELGLKDAAKKAILGQTANHLWFRDSLRSGERLTNK
jgi:predicted TIM-barrel fold metal-dependent hydrolase